MNPAPCAFDPVDEAHTLESILSLFVCEKNYSMGDYRNISGMGITVNAGANSSALPLDLSGFQAAITSATNLTANIVTAAALKFSSYFTVTSYDAWGTIFPLINYFYDGTSWETLEIRPAPAAQTGALIQLKKNGHQVGVYGSTTGINTPVVTLGTGSGSSTRVYGDLVLDKGWSNAKVLGQRTGDGQLFPVVELSYVNGTLADQVALKEPNGYGIQANKSGVSLLGPNGQSASISSTGFSVSSPATMSLLMPFWKYTLSADVNPGDAGMLISGSESAVPFDLLTVGQGTNPMQGTLININGYNYAGYKNIGTTTLLLHVTYQVTFTSNNYGWRRSAIVATSNRRYGAIQTAPVVGAPTIHNGSSVFTLAPGGGFTLLCYQNSGNNIGYLTTHETTNEATHIHVALISY